MSTLVPLLLTQRLRLRQILSTDMHYLYPISFYNGLPIHTEEGIRNKLAKINEDIQSGNSLHWGIELTENTILIGTVGFYRGFKNKTGEIGYILTEGYRRKGYMLEAVTRVVEFGFTELGLDKIKAYTMGDNTASIQLLLKAGFNEMLSDNRAYRMFVCLHPDKPC